MQQYLYFILGEKAETLLSYDSTKKATEKADFNLFFPGFSPPYLGLEFHKALL